MSALKTDFVEIARGGITTVDGRTIPNEALLSIEKTYNPITYTANVFPEHFHFADKLGEVKEVKTKKNSDGSVSLLAVLSPNQIWLDLNSKNQKQFSSIEIVKDVPEKGKWYLSGLGATDSPASLFTEKISFFSANQNIYISNPQKIDFKINDLDKSDFTEQEKSLFGRFLQFFKQDNNDMANEALKELQIKFSAMETQFNDLKAKKSGDSGAGDDNTAKFSAIEKENGELKAKVAALEKDNANFVEAFKKFDDFNLQLTEYKTKVDAALQESPGSDGNDNKFGADTPDNKVVNGINSDWV